MSPKLLLVTTSCWYPAARLAMALAKAQCRVEIVCPSGHPVAKTRAVERILPYHGLAPRVSIAQAIAKAQPRLIIPGDDLATRHLHALYSDARADGREQICKLIERSLGAARSFDTECARTAFIERALAEGIRVPRTQIIANMDDLRKWFEQAGFPFVIKADGTSGGCGVRVVHTPEQAERAFRSLHAPASLARAVKRALVDQDLTLLEPAMVHRRPVVNAQMFVKGREATSTVACWRGNILAALHFEVVRKRSSTGPATVVRRIENAEMSAAVERMVRRLDLSGLHGFDFMLEAATDAAYMIEMNARATQVGHLTLGPGRDIPAALHSIIAGVTMQAAPVLTERETIALFPQEWIRDPESEFLRSAYHDVPWEEPDLIHDCVRNRRKQHSWYANRTLAEKPSVARSSSVPLAVSQTQAPGLD